MNPKHTALLVTLIIFTAPTFGLDVESDQCELSLNVLLPTVDVRTKVQLDHIRSNLGGEILKRSTSAAGQNEQYARQTEDQPGDRPGKGDRNPLGDHAPGESGDTPAEL